LPDKRPVDDLSIEELERILMLKKRDARMQRFRANQERVVGVPLPGEVMPDPVALVPTAPPPRPAPAAPPSHPAAYDDSPEPRFEDDPYPRVLGYEASAAPVATTKTVSRLFLAVELLAILGLAALLYVGYSMLTSLDEQEAQNSLLSATLEAGVQLQQIQPTATPLIEISQVVLPGGHVWDENGQHQFNLNEVPAPYRDAFRAKLAAPRADFAPMIEGGPVRLVIPALTMDVTVRAGDDWNTLQASVGHLTFSGNPGVRGNMVLVGHNDIYGEVFKRLEELNAGDEIRVQSTNGQWYTYRVREKQVVEPSEVWVLDQSLGQDRPLVTLITCYPYRVNTHRMIVFAELTS
jgi:sortase A